MPTEAHRQRNKRYRKTQDQIVLTIPKGSRDAIKKHALSKGKSVNSLITGLLEVEIGNSLKELAKEYTDHSCSHE